LCEIDSAAAPFEFIVVDPTHGRAALLAAGVPRGGCLFLLKLLPMGERGLRQLVFALAAIDDAQVVNRFLARRDHHAAFKHRPGFNDAAILGE